MNPKWLKLAAAMLHLAADEFANHGCNDWDFPADWTHEDQVEFVRAAYADNGTSEDFNENRLVMPDWWIMGFLAKRLSELAERKDDGCAMAKER